MARVLNKHRDGVPAGAVYIGRGSPCGNPHRMADGSEAERRRVCEAYDADVRRLPALQAAIMKTAGHDVVCFCAPKRCHGDTVAFFANATQGERDAWLRGGPETLPARGTTARNAPGGVPAVPLPS